MAVVLKRRELLGAGIIGVGLAGAACLPVVQVAGDDSVLVVRQRTIPESEAYAGSFLARARASRTLDIGADLGELLGEWPVGPGIVTGLTSDPVAMIARQLLIERGAEPVLAWEHGFASGRWEHRLEKAVPANGLPQLAWPAVIAMLVRDRLEGRTMVLPRLPCEGKCTLADGSPGLLVTWAFRMNGGAW